MRDYFIRRFLLIIPTLIGATLVVFGITRITPGGPYERAMQAALMGDHGGGGKNAGGSLSQEQKDEMAAYYGFDKPYLTAYAVWLGIMRREETPMFIKFEDGKNEVNVTLKMLLPRAEWKPNNAYKITQATITRDGKLTAPDADALKVWKVRAEPEKQRVVVYRPQFNGLLQGNFGLSTVTISPCSA